MCSKATQIAREAYGLITRTLSVKAWRHSTNVLFTSLLVLFLPMLVTAQSYTTGPKEYCAQETFNASCASDHVVLMTSAMYGRMSFGRCMKEDHGHKGCHTDVLGHIDEQCSGLRRCNVPIPLSAYSQHPNCPSELMSYLEADYKCLKVQANTVCPRENYQRVGIIGNSTHISPPSRTLKGSPGSRSCPWKFKADKGRKINITLFSFNMAAASYNMAGLTGYGGITQCQDFLTIDDGGYKMNKPLCAEHMRERLLYMSTSHEITVYVRYTNMPSGEGAAGRFLLKVTAKGCADIGPIEHASVVRDGDVTKVQCNHTGETFFLSCTGTTWQGELHNCSKASLKGGNGSAVTRTTQFPYGLLLVIGIGVALGVALGIILLAAILTCARQKKHTKTFSQHTSDPLLSEGAPLSEDANSNYYERRNLATIGRSPRVIREPIYTERAHLNAQQGSSSASPGIGMTLKCQSLPYTGRKVHNGDPNEIYCTCPQPATATIYGRASTTPRAHTSFITFKPENELVDVYGSSPDDRRQNSDTRSLDLIRESESQNLENLQRAAMTPQLSDTRCYACGLSRSKCPCTGSFKGTMPRPGKTQYNEQTMCNNKSV